MDDIAEVDHKVPRSSGGTDLPYNRQLLHGHCHDKKTARDVTLTVKYDQAL
jgi:RNA-directed DNA polymerase